MNTVKWSTASKRERTRPDGIQFPGIGSKLTEIARAILANYHYLDDDKVSKIEDILKDARKHIGQIIFER
ncbi:MAG: hypothetical protein WCE82_08880 [Halobacteriota archaeon]